MSLTSQPYNAILELVKKVHFNKEKPENFTCKVSDISRNVAKIRGSNGIWFIVKIRELNEMLYTTYGSILLTNFSKHLHKIPLSMDKRMANLEFMNDLENDNEKYKKRLFKELTSLLYNKGKEMEFFIKSLKHNIKS
jgi:hypothetical protein